MKLVPLGARVLVDPVEPLLELEARMVKIGLYAVIADEKRPKPTSGVVVAVGTDPFVQEHVQVGDIVFFAWTSGTGQMVQGKEYRSLEFRELISVLKPDTPTSPASSVVTELPPGELELSPLQQQHQPKSSPSSESPAEPQSQSTREP